MLLSVQPFRPQFGDIGLRVSSVQRPSLLNAPDQPFFYGQISTNTKAILKALTMIKFPINIPLIR
jgi:hypothetical protein